MEPHILNFDFPPSIETERLTIRSLQPGDGPAFHAAILETLEGLQTWLGIYQQGPPTVDETEALARAQYAKFIAREELWLVCFLKGTDIVVASSGLTPTWETPSFEIGYWCRRSYQGQGYVTEAVLGITDFALTHLHAKRVFIRCATMGASQMARCVIPTSFRKSAQIHHRPYPKDQHNEDCQN